MILFDQFPRNMFRGQAEQFATDHLALAIAKAAVDREASTISSSRRSAASSTCRSSTARISPTRIALVLLFTALGDDDQLGYARKHHDIIDRFGRFPHRNAILGRAPRPDEIAAGDVFPW